jgi:hypothetical protein
MLVPDGYGLKRPLIAIHTSSCCCNFKRKEGSKEQISQTITHAMGLSVSCCMGSEVSVSDPDRSGKANSGDGVQAIYGYAGCEVVELNVQPDHVHLVLKIPPKVSISELLGRLKGQTSMKLLHQFRFLKKKQYWGNHF